MWNVDARCSQCSNKPGCEDRKVLLPALSELSHKLTTQEMHVDSLGDGIIIVSCKDFA